MFKNSAALHYASTLLLVVRAVLLEKTGTAVAVAWAVVSAATVSVAGLFGWTAAVVVAVAVLAVYRPLQRAAAANQYRLVRSGDAVEYAEPDETLAGQSFAVGRVLRRLSRANALKTGRFDADLLELYEHYYLLDTGEGNRLIPFEWIIAIETGSLEIG